MASEVALEPVTLRAFANACAGAAANNVDEATVKAVSTDRALVVNDAEDMKNSLDGCSTKCSHKMVSMTSILGRAMRAPLDVTTIGR